jgi:hypothetical protein
LLDFVPPARSTLTLKMHYRIARTYRHLSGQKLAILLCLAVIPLSSCFVRRRTVAPQGAHENRPLLTATKEELLQRIASASESISSFSMTADMSPSVGRLYGGEVTDYATLPGYILFRKPDDIRIIGLDPVIHGKAFDMVSTGPEFRLYIPSKNRFVEGRNDVPANSKNKLENLRPAAFLNSLLIYPPDPKTDVALVEDDINDTRPIYVVLIIRREHDQLKLVRSISFDRYTLQIVRQRSFDEAGHTLSDAKYSEWKNYGDTPFPSSIDIQRPQDGYEVSLSVMALKINTPDVTPEKFVLNQPPGTQLQQVSQ